MSIYKHVDKQQQLSSKTEQNETEPSDTAYEYFSDKEEAESYKKRKNKK